ncbi:MAG: hypothetical protein HXY34_01235 [Candidatus Thorarchaeota archaeon]|nr:hypothetical protein [Candidatus Thorarchaeota archaeon]
MGDDDDLEAAIKDEFEWALKDPTEEKLRGLGDVVTTITMKMVEAMGQIESKVAGIQSQLQSLEAKVSSLESRVSRGVAPSPGADMSPAEAGPAIAKAPVAAAPKAATSTPTGGGMMGELKALLAARKKKVGSETE